LWLLSDGSRSIPYKVKSDAQEPVIALERDLSGQIMRPRIHNDKVHVLTQAPAEAAEALLGLERRG
jgi:hypothetical protein